MKSIKVLLAVAALSVSGLASAGGRDVHSVVVRYGDLNLSTQAGVTRLHKRIRNAAQSVCSDLDTRILGLRQAYDSCVNDALANGIAAVGKTRGVVVAANE
jgi:UrcA family protein